MALRTLAFPLLPTHEVLKAAVMGFINEPDKKASVYRGLEKYKFDDRFFDYYEIDNFPPLSNSP